MLQRIKKVERTWKTADAEPEEKVTFQVEAFKTIGGSLKGSDQHYGGYSLRGAHRREVVKEYEVGFAEVPGLAAGADWPFDRKRLFHMLQPYEADSSLFDRVKFHASRRWTLTATLASDGSHRVHSPELGLDLPKKPPTSDLAKVPADPASKALVLIAGEGLAGFAVGKSKREDVDKVLGAPLEYVPAGDNHNASYRGGLTCNFDATGVLNTVFTRASFAGRTKDGLQLGMTRDEVQKKLGKKQGDAAATWTLPGLVVKFDATGVVQRLVVTKG
jgi:outer membrane protein assembly factor BamE (lipoprotein component of BamABCDE complex)